MHPPRVSVVLPVWNGERYLSESIDSVLGQEYADFELLICDDSSTDNSIRIVESKKDPRIKFIKNNTNQGLFKTLNRLIKQSDGELVHLWCQDDIMKPHCLKAKVGFYKQHPGIGFCYSACDRIGGTDNIVWKAAEENTPDLISSELATQMLFYFGSIPGNIANVMIKKAIFSDVGFFREDMRIAGDLEMWARISEKYPIGFIRQPLIYIRLHRGQSSRQKGIGLVYMREEREIVTALIKRLPSEIVPYAKLYNRWCRHVQYLHNGVRCLLSGSFEMGLKIYQEICQVDDPILVTALWLFTINRRLFKKKPKFVEKI